MPHSIQDTDLAVPTSLTTKTRTLSYRKPSKEEQLRMTDTTLDATDNMAERFLAELRRPSVPCHECGNPDYHIHLPLAKFSNLSPTLPTVRSSSTIASSAPQHNRSRSSSQESKTTTTTESVDVADEDGKGGVPPVDVVNDGPVGNSEPSSDSDAGKAKELGEVRDGEFQNNIQPARPSLASSRTSSYFDVREGGAAHRRWRTRNDRNALANPGASLWKTNNS